MIKFGPSGNPDQFYDDGFKASTSMPLWVKNQGLDAYEYQCSKGVKITEKTARQLGENAANMNVETVPTGSLSLDIALGLGGLPKGRIIEIYGPESSGKTTLAIHAIAESQKQGGLAAFIDAEHALDPVYAKNLGVDIENLILSALMATCVAGCGGNTSTSTNSNSGTPVLDDFENTIKDKTPVTITYAGWNLGSEDAETPNIERMLIDEFEQEYPWITVEIIERPKITGTNNDQDWSEFLGARASIKQLPDVFMVDTLPNYIINNWVKDISDIVSRDGEYAKLAQDVRGAAVYEGMTFALPTAIHYQGYVVNNTLFDKANQDYVTPETEWSKLISELNKAATHEAGGQGVAGIQGIEHIIHCYPGIVDQSLEWFTFDGKKFNLDSDAFKQAVEFYLSIYNNNKISFNYLMDQPVAEGETSLITQYFGEGDPWNNEKMLVKWVETYNLTSLQQEITEEKRTCEYDFIGFPGVNGVKRTPISMDFNAVSSQTKNPEAAYLLARYLGFGTKGYAKRFELSTTTDGLNPVNFAPLIADEELLDRYFNELYPDFPGYREVVESQSFIAEPVKYMVGYNEVRYTGTYDPENRMFDIINEKLLKNQVSYASISSELNKRANAIYAENSAKFNESLNKYYISAK